MTSGDRPVADHHFGQDVSEIQNTQFYLKTGTVCVWTCETRAPTPFVSAGVTQHQPTGLKVSAKIKTAGLSSCIEGWFGTKSVLQVRKCFHKFCQVVAKSIGDSAQRPPSN